MTAAYRIIILFSVLILLGLAAMRYLNMSYTGSNETQSTLEISYSWSDTTPFAMERFVTAPLEGVISTYKGISEIESISGYSNGTITVSLKKGIDPDQAQFEISSLIRRIYKHLPDGVSYPNVSYPDGSSNENQQPLFIFEVTSKYDPIELTKYALSVIRPRLLSISGIHSVSLYGAQSMTNSIHYNRATAESINIKVEEIEKSVLQQLKTRSIGTLHMANGLQHNVETSPIPLEKLQTIEIKKHNDRIIRLKDIATTRVSDLDSANIYRVNKRSGLVLTIQAKHDSDILKLSAEIDRTISGIRQKLPTGYQLVKEYDGSNHFRSLLHSIYNQQIIALILILSITTIYFIGFQAALSIFIATAANVSILCLILMALEYRSNISTLQHITFSLVATSAIILAIHYQSLTNGNPPKINGLVFFTIILLISSTILSNYTEAESEVTEFIFTSAILSLSAIPVCYWLLPSLNKQFPSKNRISSKLRNSGVLNILIYYQVILKIVANNKRITTITSILIFGIPIFQLPRKLPETSPLNKSYNQILGKENENSSLRDFLEITLGGSLRLFTKHVQDKTNLNYHERTALKILIGLPSEATVSQMNTIISYIEDELEQYKQVEKVISQTRNGQSGSIIVYFKAQFENTSIPEVIKDHLIEVTSNFSGINWTIFGVGQGYNLQANQIGLQSLHIVLKGYNYSELESNVKKTEEVLKKSKQTRNIDIHRIPGVSTAKELYTYVYRIDPKRLANTTLSEDIIFQGLKKFDARGKVIATQMVDGIVKNITLTPSDINDFDLHRLKNEPVSILDTTKFILGTTGNFTREKVMSEIRKENQQYVKQISFDYLGTIIAAQAYLEKSIYELNNSFPIGYNAETSTFTDTKLIDKRDYTVFLFMLLILYFISAIHYESLPQSFILIFCVLLSFTGSFLTLYFTETEFDQGGYAAFIYGSAITAYIFSLIITDFRKAINSDVESQYKSYCQSISKHSGSIILIILVDILFGTILVNTTPETSDWKSFGTIIIGMLSASSVVTAIILPCLLISKPGTLKN